MLLNCPECGLQVSDKAATCPHCGYPMKPEKVKSIERKKSSKHRRLPNGFGQISEIRNQNLSKPFRAMVTVGKTETGRPICKLLKPVSYFKTYNEAYTALAEYNRNPYDVATAAITMQEVYEQWSKEHFQTYRNPSGIRTMESAWRYCHSIADTPIREVRMKQLKYLFDTAEYKGKTPTGTTKQRMKLLLNMLFDYANQYEIIDQNFSKLFKLPKSVKEEIKENYHAHIIYTDEEMQTLWNNVDKVENIDAILIQCYSGWRPQELCNLKISDIDLEKGFMTGGMKTEAGCNRLVPIHSRIYPLIKKRIAHSKAQGQVFLFICESQGGKYVQMDYARYKYRIAQALKKLNINPEHQPHDARKQFVTMAKKAGLDEYAIKLIVGHTISDLTEAIYTERDPEWLKTEIEKIK